MKAHRSALLIALALAGAASLARAHDPYEITADARVRADTLELHVTMARSTAMSVAAGGKEAPTFDPARFEKLRAKFEACAPSLFAVTAARETLALKRVSVALSIENDVEFHLVYAAPRKSPLRLHAMHVTKLPYGYGAAVVLFDARGGELGRRLLTAQDPEFEIELVPPARVAEAAKAR